MCRRQGRADRRCRLKTHCRQANPFAELPFADGGLRPIAGTPATVHLRRFSDGPFKAVGCPRRPNTLPVRRPPPCIGKQPDWL
ncbi:hypothetical protein [Neisseria sp.]|uniref:hypothetical protein n=1 Tax=Neisseria sp. TaxID=192066 RepID=UPI0035A0B0D4